MEQEMNEQQSEVQSPPVSSSQQQRAENNNTDSVEYWRSKFNGLQGYINNLKKERDEAVLTREQIARELAAKTTELSTVNSTLSLELDTTKKLLGDVSKKAEKLEKREIVGRKIVEEYPELTPFHTKGLLVGVEEMPEDKLADYLTQYRDTIKSMATSAIKEAANGGTPPPPNQQIGIQQANETPDMMYDRLQDLMQTKGINSPEYRRALDAYMEAVRQSTKV